MRGRDEQGHFEGRKDKGTDVEKERRGVYRQDFGVEMVLLLKNGEGMTSLEDVRYRNYCVTYMVSA